MASSRWIFALMVLLATPAAADEPSVEDLVALALQAKPLSDRWDRCTASAVRRSVGQKIDARSAAESALRRCRDSEQALKTFLGRKIGERRATGVMEQLKAAQRTGLVQAVTDLRGRKKR